MPASFFLCLVASGRTAPDCPAKPCWCCTISFSKYLFNVLELVCKSFVSSLLIMSFYLTLNFIYIRAWKFWYPALSVATSFCMRDSVVCAIDQFSSNYLSCHNCYTYLWVWCLLYPQKQKLFQVFSLCLT